VSIDRRPALHVGRRMYGGNQAEQKTSLTRENLRSGENSKENREERRRFNMTFSKETLKTIR